MITVFGATGTTGAPLVDTLLAKGATVRAVTSNPASLDALKAKGCEAVVASFTDPAALARACNGAEKIYLVTPAHLDMRQWKANVIAAAKAAGADETVVYGRAPFDKDASKALAEQFKAAVGPDGANVIYDPVGGDYAEPALRSIGWEGRYLVVGFPAGIPKLPLNLTLLKSCDVCGVFWGAFAARDPKANAAHVEHLFRLWEEGKISPHVSETFAFEDGGKAIAKLANRGAIGKLVVKVAE
ncbi:MAG: hypothetical protein CVT76_00050 [Alphaproteobacteria bacterium HGW-Alphaproteobacteria-15]|nr:MAG: hypothetical protein CVT76_00050 [Alphaproteobacteria bacterium HGW-Alphaproteobacteria-15]